MVFYVGIVI